MSYREIWFIKLGQVTSSWIKDFNALNNERMHMKSTIYKYKSTTQSMGINQQNQENSCFYLVVVVKTS